MLLPHLGDRIRKQRERQGLTQESFGRSAGIPRRTLTRLESGDPAVRIGTFEKAARALGMRLTLDETPRKRPTLEELDAIYREDES